MLFARMHHVKKKKIFHYFSTFFFNQIHLLKSYVCIYFVNLSFNEKKKKKRNSMNISDIVEILNLKKNLIMSGLEDCLRISLIDANINMT